MVRPIPTGMRVLQRGVPYFAPILPGATEGALHHKQAKSSAK